LFRGMGREPDRASAWGAKHSSFVLFCPLELLDVVLDRNASIETNSWAQALREIVISGTKARVSIQRGASRCINEIEVFKFNKTPSWSSVGAAD
jgi:hypothetical protein